jgi:acetyl esterase/lipase
MSAAVEVLTYATRDHVELCGDFYSALDFGRAPALVAVHGGSWKLGSRKEFQYLGPWLAERGVSLFSIDYRLVKDSQNRHPAAAHDVRAAVQFVRGSASQLGIDPNRIGLLGASAGAHLACLVALAGDNPKLLEGFPSHSYAQISSSVKCAVGIYGPYDLLAQWNYDQLARPHDNATQALFGKSPADDRLCYFEASPLAYATRSKHQPAFFLSWGTEDDVVDWRQQSQPFLLALKQAGFYVRTAPMLGAPHYWIAVPIEEHGSFSGVFASQLVRFLKDRL